MFPTLGTPWERLKNGNTGTPGRGNTVGTPWERIGHGNAWNVLGTGPSGDRVGVGDGARVEHGACDVHGTDSGGAHGMRGDGVGVGNVYEMLSLPCDSGDSTCFFFCCNSVLIFNFSLFV